MREARAQILVNLARLSTGWAMTHVSRFLPELVATRPDDCFVAVVPHEFRERVESWGVTVVTSPVARGLVRSHLPADRVAAGLTGLRADLILGPLSHVPLISRTPQIVWACQLPAMSTPGNRRDALGATLSHVLMARSSLVIYPTAAARHTAELLGVKGPGLILRPPLREAPPPKVAQTTEYKYSEPLRVLVPSDSQRNRNLALLGRLSSVLDRRGVDHRLWVRGDLPSGLTSTRVSRGFAYDPDELWALRDRIDVVLLPWLGESCSPILAEFERLGFPVVASSIDGHVELRDRARLFDPASPHGAADAVLAALSDGPQDGSRSDQPDWRFSTPLRYAAALSAEIDRLIDGEEIPWAV